MSADEIVTVGRPLPTLASVTPADAPYTVLVSWADGARRGRCDRVDLAPVIFTLKVFRPLRDGTIPFDTVRLGAWGGSIRWEGNDDLDIGAETVEDLAEAAMTNAEFSDFLRRNGLTLDAAAAQLGIARRRVAYFAKDREIPRYIALACRHLDQVLRPGR
ncbi:DUF2442 domain-containing protein [Methylobacterium sp. J-026]|uniref:DUF2442 domain-containing protein n=1 Tax=Methylobacterium sp. J-026 TaxID=2836624 RepID=UPI001FB861DC|nr:DUF2442 domain-containing protein [Methylobacterium sp. J-026]MCJ2133440.1 DUF2442 domain-containing protein [Methylobacterium sp. J-026]